MKIYIDTLQDWANFPSNGRIIVGWKRIAIGYPKNYWQLGLNIFNVVNFKPLSTFKIVRKKWGERHEKLMEKILGLVSSRI